MNTQTPTDTRCAEAMARLTAQINRSAGQHARAIKRAFELSKTRLTSTTRADKPTTKA